MAVGVSRGLLASATIRAMIIVGVDLSLVGVIVLARAFDARAAGTTPLEKPSWFSAGVVLLGVGLTLVTVGVSD